MGKRIIKAEDSSGNPRDIEVHSAKNLPPDKGVAIVGGHPTKGVKILDQRPPRKEK